MRGGRPPDRPRPMDRTRRGRARWVSRHAGASHGVRLPAARLTPTPLSSVGTARVHCGCSVSPAMSRMAAPIRGSTGSPRSPGARAAGSATPTFRTPASIPAAIGLHPAGYYDGVIAPPAVAGQLVKARPDRPAEHRDRAGYNSIGRTLRAQAAVTSKGRIYGIPYAWDALVLGYGRLPCGPPRPPGGHCSVRRPRQNIREDHAPGQPAHHRARGAVPQVGAALARHRRPVRTHRQPVRGGDRVLENGRRSITQYYSPTRR